MLEGHNGAGKSTLLSLINGDHPQSYANEIFLFGHRRGSGESIWDIKQKIGFISPELHWCFDMQTTCLNTLLSGFFDTPGLYKSATTEQTKIAIKWLDSIGLLAYKDIPLASISPGLQRMVLLLRVLVKNPPLLIFDEPCQGLDEIHVNNFIDLVDRLFYDTEHTIIYVSHISSQIPKCINKKLCLKNGKIVDQSL